VSSFIFVQHNRSESEELMRLRAELSRMKEELLETKQVCTAVPSCNRNAS
jgi:hypothetical protein